MVDRIRKMLGVQAESGMLPIHHATLSGDGSIQKVARIELDSRLSGPNLHLTTGGEIQNSSRQLQFSHLLAQHVIVVVPRRLSLHLRNAGTDGRGSCEVGGSALHGLDFTRGNQRSV